MSVIWSDAGPAVLVTVFNRPDKTRRILDVLSHVPLRRLYIAADGPRPNAAADRETCEEVRRIVSSHRVDGRTETLFQAKNLGCGRGMVAAIDWFFDNEEAGIILEDDCLPSQSFFRFCVEMLQLYAHDERVSSISGSRLPRVEKCVDASYSFSHYHFAWGWASWRRAWKYFDYDASRLDAFDARNLFDQISGNDKGFRDYWYNLIDDARSGRSDIWDYQWVFACWVQGGLSCIPAVNLVTNIGFDSEGTHCLDAADERAGMEAGELDFPLNHPKFFVADPSIDRSIRQNVYNLKQKQNTFASLITRFKTAPQNSN